jgi:hypothetical protein
LFEYSSNICIDHLICKQKVQKVSDGMFNHKSFLSSRGMDNRGVNLNVSQSTDLHEMYILNSEYIIPWLCKQLEAMVDKSPVFMEWHLLGILNFHQVNLSKQCFSLFYFSMVVLVMVWCTRNSECTSREGLCFVKHLN